MHKKCFKFQVVLIIFINLSPLIHHAIYNHSIFQYLLFLSKYPFIHNSLYFIYDPHNMFETIITVLKDRSDRGFQQNRIFHIFCQ